MDINDLSSSDLSYVVVGFFTPDYRARAEAFSKNLSAFGIPHHLYAVLKTESWQSAILLKPSIALRAMSHYPNRTIIQMDIDCRVSGPLGGMLYVDNAADISLKMRVKISKRRALTWPSSRVLVFRNKEAKKLIHAWKIECDKVALGTRMDQMCDEQALMRAIAKTTGVAIDQLPDAYAGFETGETNDIQVVSHDSAHDTVRFMMAKRRKLKAARRWLISKVVGVPYASWKYGD